MKTAESMPAHIRRDSMVEWINAQGFVNVNSLCERYSVSPATIRNDLRDLEAAQLIERLHGGAASSRKAAYELNTAEKSNQQTEEKEIIAQAALHHIQPGDVIALDSGTTTYQLARLLGGFDRLTVVTYDLQIAAWLESNTEVNIIMAGGQVRRNFHCTCGQTANDTLSRLHVDKLFLAANSLNKDGLYTPSLEMCNIKSTLIRNADTTILLADSTKMNRCSFARFAEIKDIHLLITDKNIAPDFLEILQKKGLQVEQV